ncbi:efflux RND transporter periplasmic adaptor subunit [Leptolyngbya cf. ectocarpi LEGE 11479]|uniref:Efflux RND transporter periplasmic adaptor subunit n=1 Tax=Leptolyngbya cf. ectocarpi LEGE 11479 TaxID=1828722 RepID=A0A928ZV53_LEPEC|nr:efflux RND transporter periplasmic adaptor subunit [Leptolyngbya ectocarpi]MBE9068057.1 efflux RND transporter periplasmic adaptor subunit [Leptolyngbya cf. ectocarpi LEGE 11479]
MVTQSAQRPFKKTSFWIGMALLLLVGGASLLTLRSVRQARQAAIEEAAKPPPERVDVAALGRIEPKSRVIDIAAAETGVLARLLVEEGAQVQTGQVLAELDMYDVRKAERDYAASQLAEAQKTLNAERGLGAARIVEANTQAGQIDQPQIQAIEAQTAKIRSLEARLSLAKIDLARFENLLSQGAITQQEFDRQQTEVDELTSDVANAVATKKQLELARDTALDNAAAQVSMAEADLQLASVETGVESAQQNLALADARLNRAVVKAPSAGQVLDIYIRPGEAVAENRLMSMGNTDEMYVVAEVYETDVGLVKPGQKATITSRNGAFEGALSGTVETIGLQIFKNDVLDDDPAANADARIVEVRIAVDQDEAVAMLTNLQVDVLIDIKSDSDSGDGTGES